MKLIKIIAVAMVLTGLSIADASAANLFQRRYHHYRHHRYYRHHRHYRGHARVDVNLPAHPRLPPPPPPPPRP